MHTKFAASDNFYSNAIDQQCLSAGKSAARIMIPGPSRRAQTRTRPSFGCRSPRPVADDDPLRPPRRDAVGRSSTLAAVVM
jgi:hypothetical protein